MGNRLVVVAMGHKSSGKSQTWKDLLDQSDIRTHRNPRNLSWLPLYEEKGAWVFIVNGSPQERNKKIEDMLQGSTPNIVLCSIQYIEGAMDTFNYFLERDYDVYVQWLNPGFQDKERYSDHLKMVPELLYQGATLCVADGKPCPIHRVEKIREFVHGWAVHHGFATTAASFVISSQKHGVPMV